jgi:hypothetical protein
MESLAFNGPSGKIDILLPGPLIEVAFLCGLESAGLLEHHAPDRVDVLEVQASYPHTVDPGVAHHQHPELAVTLGFGPHQSGEELYFLRIMGNCSHLPTSLQKMLSVSLIHVYVCLEKDILIFMEWKMNSCSAPFSKWAHSYVTVHFSSRLMKYKKKQQ